MWCIFLSFIYLFILCGYKHVGVRTHSVSVLSVFVLCFPMHRKCALLCACVCVLCLCMSLVYLLCLCVYMNVYCVSARVSRARAFAPTGTESTSAEHSRGTQHHAPQEGPRETSSRYPGWCALGDGDGDDDGTTARWLHKATHPLTSPQKEGAMRTCWRPSYHDQCPQQQHWWLRMTRWTLNAWWWDGLTAFCPQGREQVPEYSPRRRP